MIPPMLLFTLTIPLSKCFVDFIPSVALLLLISDINNATGKGIGQRLIRLSGYIELLMWEMNYKENQLFGKKIVNGALAGGNMPLSINNTDVDGTEPYRTNGSLNIVLFPGVVQKH